MLPEIGATELMVIAAVALIVVGPKDLPVLLRKLGQMVGRVRSMAHEFRSSFDEMARQSELDDLRREVAAMRAGQPMTIAKLDDGEVGKVFDDINADLSVPAYDPTPADAYPAPDAALPVETPVAPVKRARKAAAKPAASAAPVKKAAAKPRAAKATPADEAPKATKTAARKTSKAKA